MEYLYKSITIDNVYAELFAPAGIIINGALDWVFGTYPLASVVFDTIKTEAVLSVGDKDFLPRTVTVKNNPNSDAEGRIEYVFGAEKEVVVAVTREMEQSLLDIIFTERKEVVAYVTVRTSKRCVNVTIWGDPHSVFKKLINQTKEETDHDTGETGGVTVATVCD